MIITQTSLVSTAWSKPGVLLLYHNKEDRPKSLIIGLPSFKDRNASLYMKFKLELLK